MEHVLGLVVIHRLVPRARLENAFVMLVVALVAGYVVRCAKEIPVEHVLFGVVVHRAVQNAFEMGGTFLFCFLSLAAVESNGALLVDACALLAHAWLTGPVWTKKRCIGQKGRQRQTERGSKAKGSKNSLSRSRSRDKKCRSKSRDKKKKSRSRSRKRNKR